MDLVKRLEEYRDREREIQWEGTFAQYFEIATKKQEVTRLAHERIYHMIMDSGVGTSRTGEPLFNFFSDEIFGIEKPLQQIVEYFHSAPSDWKFVNASYCLWDPSVVVNQPLCT